MCIITISHHNFILKFIIVFSLMLATESMCCVHWYRVEASVFYSAFLSIPFGSVKLFKLINETILNSWRLRFSLRYFTLKHG